VLEDVGGAGVGVGVVELVVVCWKNSAPSEEEEDELVLVEDVVEDVDEDVDVEVDVDVDEVVLSGTSI
jgi:hypothetical protein